MLSLVEDVDQSLLAKLMLQESCCLQCIWLVESNGKRIQKLEDTFLAGIEEKF